MERIKEPIAGDRREKKFRIRGKEDLEFHAPNLTRHTAVAIP